MSFEIQSTFKKEQPFTLYMLLFSVCFAALFNGAALGLNVAVLIALLVGYWLFDKPKRFKNLKVLFTTTLTAITAIAIAWYGTWDVLLWGFLCLLLLHQLVYFEETSILLFESKGISNLFVAPIQGLYTTFTTEEKSASLKSSRLLNILLYGILPLAFLLFFASIYKNLNPLFETLYLDFFEAIDLKLFGLLLLGAFISYSIFKPQHNEKLFLLDSLLPNNFSVNAVENKHITTERKVGVLLFSLLNIMLLVFLVSDALFLNQIKLGLAADYAKYVHQGIGLLIFSILIASAFILFFFRDIHNAQLQKAHPLKVLAIVWIVLNIGIVLTTFGKNLFYVGSYGLSLKRIGVFIYLALSVIGLIMVLLKIQLEKTNTYLIRSLYWSFFTTLSLCVFMDWSMLTIRFNLKQNIMHKANLDWNYLFDLSQRNLPILMENEDLINFKSKTEKANFNIRLKEEQDALYNYLPDFRELSFALQNAKNQID